MKEAEVFRGTQIFDILNGLHNVYTDIENAQIQWKKASPMNCPEGCGTCCHDFEPDVLESEALYMAAWMLVNQKEKAELIMEGNYIPHRFFSDTALSNEGCFLFNPDDPYHCTVYEGRALICRLFGYSGDLDKNGKHRWKPCKFYQGLLKNNLEKRQYSEEELSALCGDLPPVMSQAMSQALSLTPEDPKTYPLREALPAALLKLKLILRFLGPDPSTPNPAPNTPEPLSA